MVDLVQSGNKGAPLKAFILILLCWVGGRFLWENTGKDLQAMDSQIASLAALNENPPSNKLGLAKAGYKRSLIAVIAPKQETGLTFMKETRSFLSSLPKFSTKPSILYKAEKPASIKEPSIMSQASLPESKSNFHKGRPDNNFAPGKKTNGRLSGYFWIFGRQKNNGQLSGPEGAGRLSPPSILGGQYGGSQAGAILNYRISGTPKKNISAFARISTALSVSGQEEIAIGIKAKPKENIPVTFFAEQRFHNLGTEKRSTALYAAGGTGPDILIEDVSLQTYGQAGYVFGDIESHFFDVSAAIEKPVFSVNQVDVAVGGGVWAGGQKNVRRLDVGPRVSAQVPVFNNPVRVSLEWRQRVEGNASPGSGFAATISTGF